MAKLEFIYFKVDYWQGASMLYVGLTLKSILDLFLANCAESDQKIKNMPILEEDKVQELIGKDDLADYQASVIAAAKTKPTAYCFKIENKK